MKPDNAREEMLKAHEIVVAEITPDGVSSQEKVKVEDDQTLPTPDNAIEPPLSLEQLAALTESSSTRSGCISAMATNTVGLGYDLEVVNRSDAPEKPDAALAELRGRLEALARRDVRLDKPSFTSLLSAVKWDEEEVGNGYIEVSRSRTTGLISGLYHCPGKRVRRLKSRRGYVLMPTDGDIHGTPFYEFGQKVAYDNDRRPIAKLRTRGLRWDVNELLPFRIYNSRSRDYGLPRDVSNIEEYMIDRLIMAANASFFGSGGSPPHIIFVQGVETREGERITFRVPPETPAKIAQTMSSSEPGRRVAIIPLPPGTETKDVKLGEMSDRDIGNIELRDDHRRRTLSSFRMSGIFIADEGDGGRYTAEVQRAITHEQVFDPEQNRYEDRLHTTLLSDLGYEWAGFSFRELAIEGNSVRRESASRAAEGGVILRSEYREAYGYTPLPEAKKSDTEIEWDGGTYKSEPPEPGQVPFGWNSELVELNQPRGAENRNPESDQRGLEPGIGGRERRSDEPPATVTRRTRQAKGRLEDTMGGNGRRATRAARRGLSGG